jgi:hypothetical protein
LAIVKLHHHLDVLLGNTKFPKSLHGFVCILAVGKRSTDDLAVIIVAECLWHRMSLSVVELFGLFLK